MKVIIKDVVCQDADAIATEIVRYLRGRGLTVEVEKGIELDPFPQFLIVNMIARGQTIFVETEQEEPR